jgi:hypothetical protein
MVTYLFSLGLIPVQEWIGQARRSRDLRAGSVLLCHLMARFLERLARPGVKIVVPSLPSPADLAQLCSFKTALDIPYGIPHRVSGYLETAVEGPAGDREVRDLLGALEREVVEATWQDFKKEYLKYLPHLADPEEQEFWCAFAPELERLRGIPAADECPFSLIWAAMSAPFPEERTPDNLAAIDRLYADVKRARPYRPCKSGAPVGKCLQCGRREAVGPREGDETWRAWHRNLEALPSVQKGIRLDPGDRLCHVCWTRRMAGYESAAPFPSTGEIASVLWRQEVEKRPELEPLLSALQATEVGRHDLGTALYASPGCCASAMAKRRSASFLAGRACGRGSRRWGARRRFPFRPIPRAISRSSPSTATTWASGCRPTPARSPRRWAYGLPGVSFIAAPYLTYLTYLTSENRTYATRCPRCDGRSRRRGEFSGPGHAIASPKREQPRASIGEHRGRWPNTGLSADGDRMLYNPPPSRSPFQL